MRFLNSFFLALLSLLIFNTEEYTTVQGKISDQQNDPLIGVSVMVQGTSIGTVSDYNGYFLIKVPKQNDKLEFHYIGFSTKVVPVDHSKEKMKLDLVMEEVTGVLDEIVVTAYRNVKEQSNVTYSVQKVSGNRQSKRRRKRNKSVAFYSASIPKIKEPSKSINIKKSSQKENDFVFTKEENTSTFSIDVDRASYSSIRNYINREQLPPKEEVRVEEMINYFHYEYPLPKKEEPIAVQTQLTDCPWNPKSKLLHLGLQGAKLENKDLPASNFVFLIDVSGSMNQQNKLPLLKSSFLLLLNNLRPEDRVAIVSYAGYSALVLPSASAAEKEKIIESLNKLGAGGGTAGAQGIQDAYKIASKNFIQNGNNRVILATDGDFNIGIRDDDQLVKLIEEKRNSGIYLSVLGFGMGNYKDSKMQKLANKGNGNHAYIDNIKEAKKVFVHEFGGTLFTIAKDVKLQISFNEDLVKSYRLVGYENRMLKNEDFDDDKKDAGELGAGHVVTAMYELELHDANEINGSGLAELKFRYKSPEEQLSKKIMQTIDSDYLSLEVCDSDLQFSIAVAEFGMILRDSKYLKAGNLDHVIHLADLANKGNNSEYRKEFVALVEKAKILKSKLVMK